MLAVANARTIEIFISVNKLSVTFGPDVLWQQARPAPGLPIGHCAGRLVGSSLSAGCAQSFADLPQCLNILLVDGAIRQGAGVQ